MKKTLKRTMNKINKLTTCGTALLILFLFSFSSFAQDEGKHEFSIYGGGGVSSLLYKTKFADDKLGLGGLVGLGYNFAFTPKLSINTGAELALYNSKLSASPLNTTSRGYDGTYWFDYAVTHNKFEEKQHATYVQIPLTLQFQSAGRTKFYASVGAKYGFNLDGKFDVTADNFSAVGKTITQGQPDPAVSAVNGSNIKHSGKLKLDDGVVLGALEAGIKWPLSPKTSLYTGAYVDYSLSEPINLLQLQPVLGYKTNPERNSIVNSPSFSDVNVNLLAVGIKVKLAIHSGRRQAKAKPAPAPAPPPPPAPAPAPAPAPPPPPAPAPPPPPAPAQPTASELATLNATVKCFAFDKSNLPDGAKALLDSKAEILKKYPNISITCVGHTDNYGSDEVNDRLGKNRAEAVKAYLVSKGVSESRITTETKGKREPAVPNNTAANRCENRRVEFKVR